MMIPSRRASRTIAFGALLAVAACGGAAPDAAPDQPAAKTGEADAREGEITLTAQQIRAAGIEIVRPAAGGGALSFPATIEGDPQATQVVSAAIGGRVVALTRNLGETVRRGDTLAVLESREAAALKAEIEAAGARAALAQSNLRRERRLFAERVSPEQDLIAARTAASEAGIALRLARQQLAAAGGGGGGLNRLNIVAPLGGQVIARKVVLGQTVAADAELFRVANLGRLAVTLSLSSADAGRVRTGTPVEVSAAGRRAAAKVGFVSPVLDESTRLVQVIALIDNAAGLWRVGEPVTATLSLPSAGAAPVSVPGSAVQTVDDRAVVFVRTAKGFRAVPVTPGDASGDRVSITSGLTGREAIAGANSFVLKAELGKSEAGHED